MWLQNGGTWIFGGKLKPFKPNRVRASVTTVRPASAHHATPEEIEATKRKVKRETRQVTDKAKADSQLRKYAKKSNKKQKKSQRSKASRRDEFSKARAAHQAQRLVDVVSNGNA